MSQCNGKTEYSRRVKESGREYFISDIREVCAAVLDLASGVSVTLMFNNGSQPLGIDFEDKTRAINFFNEVSDEIFLYQKQLTEPARVASG